MIEVNFLPTLPSLLTEPNVPLIHRDLSWLQFNDRVLVEARQAGNPLFERLKFLSISASNLDEFFMIRFASLQRQISAHMRHDDKEKVLHLSRIRSTIFETVAKFGAKQVEALELLAAELHPEGIQIVKQLHALPDGDPTLAFSKRVFGEQVLPKLSAPEPFAVSQLGLLDNLQLAVLCGPKHWVRAPKSASPVICAREGSGPIHVFFMDDLLITHVGATFGLGRETGILRVSRDGDFTVDLEEEDTESIPDVVRSSLSTRERGRPVRLQYAGDVRPEILEAAAKALKLYPGQVIPAPDTLCLHGLWSAVNQFPEEMRSNPKLAHPPLRSVVARRFQVPAKLFDSLKEGDALLHHPYDSFDVFVGWIQAACADPAVESIEQTVYRMDALSPVIDALKGAARGKRVRVVIELRARFDELNNLRLAEELRNAGVEVAFGFGKLKLHAKIALVTRVEGEGKRLYTHLSTGNYNAATARQYTDLSILTANAAIGADARHFFDSVMDGRAPSQFSKLVSAPGRLHRRILGHIESEIKSARAGSKARIVAKVNALVDESVIESLYRASEAGVKVDLIVRGACSLVPGVKGLSKNIRVISVVDRFLEHSRIYYFESSKVLYLSSADWMQRNFFSRLEIAFPVLDPNLYRYLEEVVIPAYVSDSVKARELTPQGTWKKRTAGGGKAPVRSQFYFEELAVREYKGTPLE